MMGDTTSVWLLLATIVSIVVTGTESVPHWSYDSNTDADVIQPADWHTAHSLCAGEKQSPLNIVTASATTDDTLGDFNFVNYENEETADWLIHNNGHAAQVDLFTTEEDNEIMPATYAVTGGGLPTSYKAVQFHFHWGSTDEEGSEHNFDGNAYPMEVHIVTIAQSYNNSNDAADQDEGVAVLGSFFSISSEDNDDLDPIITQLTNLKTSGANATITSFPLSAVMPSSRDGYYRYSGSLTTPECYQSVVWTVFSNTIPISSTQMSKFRELHFGADESTSLLVDNFRPVQDQNSRVIKASGAAAGASSVKPPTRMIAAWGGLLILSKLGTARILDAGISL